MFLAKKTEFISEGDSLLRLVYDVVFIKAKEFTTLHYNYF